MKKKTDKKDEAFIRSDGWVFTKDGMDRLKKGGLKGFNRFMQNVEAKLGKWHRVLKPLDRDAAAALKAVKGMVPRAQFLSDAIVKESDRRAKECGKAKGNRQQFPTARSEDGVKSPCEFMRLTLTDDAFLKVRSFGNAVFREFVSEAILRAAKKRG